MKETFNNFIQFAILDWSLDYRHLEGKLMGWNGVSLTLFFLKNSLLKKKVIRFFTLVIVCGLVSGLYQLRKLSIEYMKVLSTSAIIWEI